MNKNPKIKEKPNKIENKKKSEGKGNILGFKRVRSNSMDEVEEEISEVRNIERDQKRKRIRENMDEEYLF